MTELKPTQVLTGNCVLSYPHLFEVNPKSNPPRYDCILLIDKNDTATLNAMKSAIEEARKDSAKLFNGKVPAHLKSPLHDGDGPRTNGGEYGPECKGKYVLNCTSKNKPKIVMPDARTLIDDQSEMYPGVIVRADLNFRAYNYNMNTGVKAYLNSMQKVRDSAPIGSAPQDPRDVFTPVEDTGDDLGL